MKGFCKNVCCTKLLRLKEFLSSPSNMIGPPLLYDNRGIKIKRTIKSKLPLLFCMNGLTIMTGPLGRPIGRREESM